MATKYSYEYRVAYISDGSIEEMLDPTDEAEVHDWVARCNRGEVEGVEPGDAFIQKRRIFTSLGRWESVLD